jgi:hypothetical protein
MHAINNMGLLYKNTLFRSLLADGTMFNKSYGRDFADVVGQTISDMSSGYPVSNASGSVRSSFLGIFH